MRLNYPDDYEEKWFDTDCKCEQCSDNESDKEMAADHMKDLIRILYSKEPVSVFSLHCVIDELCAYLGVKELPEHLPAVARINQEEPKVHDVSSFLINQ